MYNKSIVTNNKQKEVLEMTKKQCYFTERQARRIQTYADAYGISFAEALRRILDQLLFTNSSSYSRGGETNESNKYR